MTGLGHLWHRVGARALVLVGAWSLLVIGQAEAVGTYTVTSCGSGQSSTAWMQYNGYPAGIKVGRGCGAGGTNGGMYAEDFLGNQGGGLGGNGPGAIGRFTLTAPAGTTIAGLSYSRFMYKGGDDGSWRVQARADGDLLEECYYDPIYFSSCTVGVSGGVSKAFSGLAASSLSFGIWCTPYGGGGGCGGGYSIHTAQMVVYSTSVTISDPTPPDQVALSAVPAGWQHGTVSVTGAGRDALGIKKREVLIGGHVKGAVDGVCDQTSLTPCTSPGQLVSGPIGVDTTGLVEGIYPIAVRVTDAAGNQTVSSSHDIWIDNTTPVVPAVARVGELWTDDATRQLSVQVPAQTGSPISDIRTQACLGATCALITTTPVTGVGSQIVNVGPLPGDGAWTIKTWLRDEAGNEAGAVTSTATSIGIDRVAPTATLHTRSEVDEGAFVNAGYTDVNEPSPSSGEPTVSLAIGIDGGTPVPLTDNAVVAEAGRAYRVVLTVADPAGNANTYSQPVAVIARPPDPPDTTPTNPIPFTTPATPTTPAPPRTTTEPPRTETTPVPPPPKRTGAGLTITSARITRTGISVAGRAATGLRGRPVTVRLRVRLRLRTRTRVTTVTGRTRVQPNGRWAVRLSLPKATVRADLPRRTVQATTGATATVFAGSARRRLRR